MKKNILLSLLGFSTLAVASEKVEFVNSVSTTPLLAEQKDLKFDNNFLTEHKLTAEIKENNFLLQTELGTEGKLVLDNGSNKYKVGKQVTGLVKAGYDNGTVAGSVKYNFTKAQTFVNGSYTHKDGKLTLKPKVLK